MKKSSRLVFTILLSLLLSPLASAHAADDVCQTPGANKNLRNCNLSGLNLSGYDLSNSILTGADLTNTDLSEADLSGVSSGSIKGTPSALPQDWVLIGGYLLGPKADLSNAVLKDLNLKNLNLSQASLSFALFSNDALSNTDFSGANLRYAAIVNSKITGVSFENSDLKGLYTGQLDGEPSALPTDWDFVGGYLIGPQANLTSASFDGVDFKPLHITGTTFSYAHFLNSDLSGVDLSDSFIEDSIFINSKLSGTILGNTSMKMVCAEGVIGIPASLPDGWVLRSGYLIGPEANLTTLDFTNMDFRNLDLTKAYLSGSNFTNANLEDVDLSQSVIEDVNMSNANLNNTNLTGLSLKGWIAPNVEGKPIGLNPNWQSINGYLIGPGANLSSVNFSNVDLRSAKLQGVNFIYANLSGANLAGVDLTGVNLTGVNLNQTNMTDTNLSGATLTRVNAQGIVGTPTNVPDNWRFASGYLIGPGAILYSANLSGMDLKNIDLSDADLRQVNFSNADLSGAKLTGALIDTADFKNTKLFNVITGNLVGTPTNLAANFSLDQGVIKSILVLSPTPTTKGVAKVGSKITASPGAWDAGVTLTFQWFRNGEAIANANNQDYLLTPDDFKTAISVTVTGTGTGGVSKSKQSLDKPVAVGEMKATAPKITGVVAKGKTIKVSVKPWVSNASITYSWLLDGKAIKGATKSSYKVLPTQVGKKISVSVKQVAYGYTTTTKVSTAQKVK